MNGLTLYGLSAVTLMLVFYALERRSYWFVLASSGPACWHRRTVSCRGPGRSAWSRLSGPLSRYAAGGLNARTVR